MLWDLNEGKHLYTLDGGDIINALCFSPNRYWLCAATGPSIKIWVSCVLQLRLDTWLCKPWQCCNFSMCLLTHCWDLNFLNNYRTIMPSVDTQEG